MIQTLRRKFIRTAMTAVTVLLVLLLGAINLVNLWQSHQQNERLLSFLSWEEGAAHQPRGLLPPLDADDRGAARFFQVFYDTQGQIVRVNTRQIATVTEAQARAYADRCQGRDEGTVDRFRFRRTATPDGRGEVLLFLDVSSARRSLWMVLAISGGVGALCWLGTLLLVCLLSRRAIEPLARNIEKQRQFVTNAGHEIKTPLAIIQANTEAMELHQGQSKWSRNIRAQTVRLTGLMENLLTLARMEEGQRPAAQPVDLSQLAQETCRSFQEAAALREIVLEEQIDPEVVVQASRVALGQLLSILLDNGVKYTDPGGAVTLRLTAPKGGVLLTVSNTPARMPEGDPDRLFDRFYRGDAARSQAAGGYGIGLSAARAIAETWQGTIEARAEGAQTMVFTVRF